MDTYEFIINAARNNDRWRLEQFRTDYHSSLIDATRDFALTPAGYFAQSGQWDLSVLLMEEFSADTSGIIFGMMLGQSGGVVDSIHETYGPAKSKSKIKTQLITAHKDKYRNDPFQLWRPVCLAFVKLGKLEDCLQVIRGYVVDPCIKYQLLEAAVQAATFFQNQAMKSSLENELNKLWPSACQTAAQSGRKVFFEGMLQSCADNLSEQKRVIKDALGEVSSSKNPSLKEWLQQQYQRLFSQSDVIIYPSLISPSVINESNGPEFAKQDLDSAMAKPQFGARCPLNQWIAQSGVVMYFSQIVDAKFREQLLNAFERSLNNTSQLELLRAKQRFIADKKRIEEICKIRLTYHLGYQHAIMLSQHLDCLGILLTHIELDSPVRKQLEQQLQYSKIVQLHYWIQDHLPRSDFIYSLQTYIDKNSGMFCYGGHARRAQSVLDQILINTSDDEIAEIVNKQLRLFTSPKNGDQSSSFKHEKPVRNIDCKDEFYKALCAFDDKWRAKADHPEDLTAEQAAAPSI